MFAEQWNGARRVFNEGHVTCFLSEVRRLLVHSAVGYAAALLCHIRFRPVDPTMLQGIFTEDTKPRATRVFLYTKTFYV